MLEMWKTKRNMTNFRLKKVSEDRNSRTKLRSASKRNPRAFGDYLLGLGTMTNVPAAVRLWRQISVFVKL